MLPGQAGNREPQSLCSRGRQETGNPSRFAPGAGRKQGTGSREEGTGKREQEIVRCLQKDRKLPFDCAAEHAANEEALEEDVN